MRASRRRDMCHIGELAEESGVSRDTLRYYERLGLLPRPHRTSGGFRVYGAEAVERLQFIRQAQTFGLTLREIRDLVTYRGQGGLERCRHVRDLLRVRLAGVQARIAQLEDVRKTLSRALDRCERTVVSAGRPDARPEPECPMIETLRIRVR